jgi:hypothetical protein
MTPARSSPEAPRPAHALSVANPRAARKKRLSQRSPSRARRDVGLRLALAGTWSVYWGGRTERQNNHTVLPTHATPAIL